jgi:hypothetical protein
MHMIHECVQFNNAKTNIVLFETVEKKTISHLK